MIGERHKHMSNIFENLKHQIHDAVFEGDSSTPTQQSTQSQPTTQSQKAIPGISGIPGISDIPGIPGISAVPSTATQPHTIVIASSPDVNLSASMVAKLREKFAASPYNAVLTQFAATMDSLSEAIPEEGNRFRAAMKVMGKQTNLTPDQLGDAFNSLLAVLDGESGKFKQQIDAMKTREIDARDQNVQQINATIESKNKEIQTLMQQRDDIATEIIAAKTKVGATVASFEGAVSALQSEVNDSLQKLKIYFPAASMAKAK
jgi:hypothetical protein